MKYFAFFALAAAACGAAIADVPLTLAEAQRRRRRSLDAGRRPGRGNLGVPSHGCGRRSFSDPTLRASLENVPVTGPDKLNLNSDSMTMLRVGCHAGTHAKRQAHTCARNATSSKRKGPRWSATATPRGDPARQRDRLARALLRCGSGSPRRRASRAGQARDRGGRKRLPRRARTQGRCVRPRAPTLPRSRIVHLKRAASLPMRRWLLPAGLATTRSVRSPKSPRSIRPACTAHHLPTEIASHPMVAMLTRQEQIAATRRAARERQSIGRLERGVRLPEPGFPVLGHGVDRRLDSAAVGPAASAR